jgi:hypothetical protein
MRNENGEEKKVIENEQQERFDLVNGKERKKTKQFLLLLFLLKFNVISIQNNREKQKLEIFHFGPMCF